MSEEAKGKETEGEGRKGRFKSGEMGKEGD